MGRILTFLLFLSSTLFAYDISDWEGEWGSFQLEKRDGRMQYYGGESFSITNCDAKANTCQFTFFSIAEGNSKQCGLNRSLGMQNLTILSEDRAEALLYRTDRPIECTVKVGRTVQDGKKVLATALEGKGCSRICRDGSAFTHQLPFRSKSLFPGKGYVYWNCFADESPANRTACGTPETTKLEDELYTNTLNLSVLLGNTKLNHEMWREEMIEKCNKDSDPKSCVTNEYRARSQFIDNSKNSSVADLKGKQEKLSEAEDPERALAAITQMEGVYKERFKNGTVAGEKYQSENVLEIVSIGGDAVYFKTRLEAFNGHSCSLFGIARYRKNGTLVFTNEKAGLANYCLLQIKPEQDKITFVDDEKYACRRHYCGARGMFTGNTFKKSAKRPIKYMDRLKQSEDYKRSVAEFEASKEK